MNQARSSQVLDVKFIDPFLMATLKVLEAQATTKAKIGTPYRKAAGEQYLGDISGVIGLVSPTFNGSVVISFPIATFLKIMSRLLGEEYTALSKDIEDGAAELANMIFGQAKIPLNENGHGIKTALPSVVLGSVTQPNKGTRVIVPFESDAGPFFLDISTG